MMTRKDYVSTAQILNDLWLDLPISNIDLFEDTVMAFSKMFAEDNERFDHKIFYNACFKEAY
jgi:tetraacyldisaccharide-1-P 4'-kinase